MQAHKLVNRSLCVSCRQTQPGGAFQALRKSETINVSRFLKDLEAPNFLIPSSLAHKFKPFSQDASVNTPLTFQNNLNPDWKDFLIYESELGTGTHDDIE